MAGKTPPNKLPIEQVLEIRRLIGAKKWSPERVAKRIGCSVTTVKSYTADIRRKRKSMFPRGKKAQIFKDPDVSDITEDTI